MPVSRLLDRFKELGKPVHITEMGADGGPREIFFRLRALKTKTKGASRKGPDGEAADGQN